MADATSRRAAAWPDRVAAGRQAVRDIVGKVWPYVVAGIAVGAGIHGYVPENFMASLMGKCAWWSVPAAVLIGVPMYSNAAGIIPIVQALLEKGAALGTVLAFMMSVIGLSLPETIILRKVLKPALIAVVRRRGRGTGILVVGYLFNSAHVVWRGSNEEASDTGNGLREVRDLAANAEEAASELGGDSRWPR